MFPRKYRLPMRKKSDFQKTLSSQYFLLKTSPNEIGRNRFGIIISNAAVKKSVRRHLWKRRFAHYVRLWPNLKRDMLVIVSPKIESIPAKDLKKELDRILKYLTTKG